LEIIRYSSSKKNEWNDYIASSKNGTFLLNRNYMEYHSERFKDYSLMINDKDSLIALLPLSLHGNEVISHGGLTYGGLITANNIGTEKNIAVFSMIVEYLRKNNICKITYKPSPHIYHEIPSEEDLYSLFRSSFRLVGRAVSSTINMRTTSIKAKKKNGYRKAKRIGMQFVENKDSSSVLKIVNDNLQYKYGINSVHSSVEMNLLKSKFDENILIFDLLQNDEVIGGAILYLDKNVVHAQYITSTVEAKKKRGLDFIVVSIFEMFKGKYEWFDFGTSTEKMGTYLNTNLIKSKEEFGLTAVCYDTYELDIK